ncbi:MAG: hypothetical protein V3U73_03605 [bacterium]
MTKLFFSRLAFLASLIFILQFSACSGGGGGDNGGGGSSGTTLESLLVNQNISAIKYFTKLREMAGATSEMEDDMAMVSSTDIEAQEEIVRTVDEYLVPLISEVLAAGDNMIQAENDIQSIVSSFQNKGSLRPTEIREPLAIPILLSVCVGALTGISFAKSLQENTRTFEEELSACSAQHLSELDAIPSGLSEAERRQLKEQAWVNYKACSDTALQNVIWEDLKEDALFVVSELGGTVNIAWQKGKIAIKSFTAALDTTNIFILGTNPEPNNNKVLSHLIGDSPDSFVAQTNANSELIAPVGEWNIVAFKPGFARFGTPEGQRIQVFEDETTEVEASSVPVGDFTAEDLTTCGTDNTPPIEDDPPVDYVVWYTGNMACFGAPGLHVDDRDRFEEPTPKCNIAGTDCDTDVEKVLMQGGFSTWEEANGWICSQITAWHSHIWCGAHYIIEGHTRDYTLGNLSCDTSDIPEVPFPSDEL